MAASKPTPVIIDCDPGNDDAWAIISLLKAEKRFGIKLMAVTVVCGNTSVDHGCLNALLVLETFGRLDVPVHAGASSGLIKSDFRPTFHGADGFHMTYNEKPSRDLINKMHAVEALKELIEEHENEIIIFAVGPLTNIALLIKMYPGISAKVKGLWIMGGNITGCGNVEESPSSEFNFFRDPESAFIVLNESECEVMVMPLEPCLTAGESMPMYEWRLKVLNSNQNRVTNLLDSVDEKTITEGNHVNCDLYLICCFLVRDIIKKSRKVHATVELAGKHTRGQVVINHLGRSEPNATFIEEVDAEMMKRFMMWICDHEMPEFD